MPDFRVTASYVMMIEGVVDEKDALACAEEVLSTDLTSNLYQIANMMNFKAERVDVIQ